MQLITTIRKCTTKVICLACCALLSLSPPALASQQAQEAKEPQVECKVDLTKAGKMADIVSNALNRGLDQNPSEVREFLKGAQDEYPDGQSLLESAAAHFQVDSATLASEVERYRHCNCRHAGGEMEYLGPEGEGVEISKFAADVTVHVALHEMGHALVREFDLPVFGNEETLADSFATHYLTTFLPEIAADVLSARTQSLMFEASEVPRDEWPVSGEHNSDARRAFQIAALAIAADPEKYRSIGTDIGMSEDDMQSAADYGTEIHRSWRRTLASLWMPEGSASNEARLTYAGEGNFIESIRSSEIAGILREALQRIDWHSQVKLRFVDGKGKAGWSRSERTITVHSQYVHRFVRQGKQLTAAGGR